jgi:uncharacterized protein (DUF342 family)
MGRLKFKSILKKKQPEKETVKKAPQKKSIAEVSQPQKKLIKKGYARKGDLIARVAPSIPSKDGKNVYGEKIPSPQMYEPRLIAGSNVRLDKGTDYYMNCDGVVEVFKDEKGIHYIRGRLYKFGRFKIAVTEDEMEAYLTVIPPIGGAPPVKIEQVQSACKNQGIVFGLKEDVIHQSLKKAENDQVSVNDVLIAQGEWPVDGNPGKLEFHIKLASGTPFTVLGDGRVDFKEQDLITNVERGQLLAVAKKAEAGVRDGHTVKGGIIKAKPGRDTEVTVGNNITVEDKGDSLHYFAAIGGQLVTDGKRISVEHLFTVEGDVGIATGNISFEGNVLIKGSVQDNYTVISKKNIVVHGNVGSALVRAGENITVLNGVVGKSKGSLFAKGNITVKFAENAALTAGGNILIHRAALNCKLTAGGKIISKKEKGQLIGGEVKAKGGVEVKILGNESEHKMDVHTGSDFFLEKRQQELRLTRKKYEAGLKKIVLLLDKLGKIKSDPFQLPDKLKKVYAEARKKRTILNVAIKNLIIKEQEILHSIQDISYSEIIVHESLFRGVRIYFGKAFYEPDITKTKVRIFYDKNYERIKVEKIK